MVNYSKRETDSFAYNVSQVTYTITDNTYNIRNAAQEVIQRIDDIRDEIYRVRSEIERDISNIGMVISHNYDVLAKAQNDCHTSDPSVNGPAQITYDRCKSAIDTLENLRGSLRRRETDLRHEYDQYGYMRDKIKNRLANYETAAMRADSTFKSVENAAKRASSIASKIIELLTFDETNDISTDTRIQVSNINVFSNFANGLLREKEKFLESKENMTRVARTLDNSMQDEVSKECVEFASRSSVPTPLLDYLEDVSERFYKVKNALLSYLEIS